MDVCECRAGFVRGLLKLNQSYKLKSSSVLSLLLWMYVSTLALSSGSGGGFSRYG